MVITKKKINSILLFIIFALTFLGFYSIVLFLFNIGMGGLTRTITIPIRAIITFSLLLVIFFNIRSIEINRPNFYFVVFAILYIIRIIIDHLTREIYYLDKSELLFYFTSFAFLPFISINSLKFHKKYITPIFTSILLTSTVFSLLAFLAYSQYLGQVGRLSSNIVGEQVISPLILSYCATLSIGVLSTYLLFNKTSPTNKIISILTISLSAVPFFLGASRGSIFALFVPLLMITLSGKSISNSIKTGFYFVVLLISILYLDDLLGSGLIRRFSGISNAVEEGSSSASRLDIWKVSFNQFLDAPFIGDKLRVNNFPDYPHNIFLEVLQTTGILGFIPFSILVYNAWKKCIEIFSKHKEYSWIGVIFTQAFFQSLFSGAIYTAAWFWTSIALVFSISDLIKRDKKPI